MKRERENHVLKTTLVGLALLLFFVPKISSAQSNGPSYFNTGNLPSSAASQQAAQQLGVVDQTAACTTFGGAAQSACYTYQEALGVSNRGVDAQGNALSTSESQQITTTLGQMTGLRNDILNNPNDASSDLSQINNDYNQVLSEANTDANTALIQSNLQANSGCSIVPGNFSLSNCFDNGLAYASYTILSFFSWILWLCGVVFNSAMGLGVVDMAKELGTSAPSAGITSIGPLINAGWADLRDIGNLLFIFMAIFIGIRTIIGYEGERYGETKRLVRNLIIVALLVNFSLFFSKILIDASNILAVSFYNLLTQNNATNGITNVFSNALGISSVFNFTGTTVTLGWKVILITCLGGSIFLLVTAVTFLTAGALFLIRFVLLVFLMILSPIACLAWAFPAMRKYFTEWWETLVGQLIFAPLYMLLILIVAKIATGYNAGGGGGLAAAFMSGSDATAKTLLSSNSISAILYFLVIILLMNGATVIAIQQASRGQALVGKAVGWVGDKAKSATQAIYRAPLRASQATGGFAGNKTANLVGKTGRRVIGGFASNRLKSDSETGEKLRAGVIDERNNLRGLIRRAYSRTALGALEATSKVSFDARATAAIQNIGKKSGIDFGKARGEGGYRAQLERESKEERERIKNYGGASEATLAEVTRNRAALLDAREELAAAIASGDSAQIAAARGKVNKMDGEVKKSERKQTKEKESQLAQYLIKQRKSSTAYSLFSGRHKASYDQAIEDFTKDKKGADEKEEKKLKMEQTVTDVDAIVATGDETKIKDTISNMKREVIEDLPGRIVTNETVFRALSPSTRQALSRSKKLTEGEQKKIQEHQKKIEEENQPKNQPGNQTTAAPTNPPSNPGSENYNG